MPQRISRAVVLLLLVAACAAHATARRPLTAVAYSPDGTRIAVGDFKVVTLLDSRTGKTVNRLPGHAGRINALAYRPQGDILAAAGGSPSRAGQIRLWDAHTGRLLTTLTGHTDSIYGIAFSPNGELLAAAGYDHLVSLWRIGTRVPGRSLSVSGPMMLKDHTDAVYAVAFSPDGRRLASAAGDRTVKVWDTTTRRRLYTLSEATGELYTVAWRPDGAQLAAGGVDRSIRTYNIRPDGGALAHAAIAHDGPVLRLLYDSKGATLFSAGQDGVVKRWDAARLEEQAAFPREPEWPQSTAISPDDAHLAIGRQDGILLVCSAQTGAPDWQEPIWPAVARAVEADGVSHRRAYCPVPAPATAAARTPGNESPERAQPVSIPTEIKTTLESDAPGAGPVAHYYRFHASRGEMIDIEVMAHRSGSPLDSELAVLDAAGKPVERAVLRAIGQTELTLSDRDSNSPALRLLSQPDLHLRDLVLIGREVNRVVALPKGPDDDTFFQSYRGRRLGLFGTTPEYHSIGAPIYKVEAYPPGTHFSANGMPVTHLTYVNDDGGPLYGQDSFLDFAAPADGDYIVQIRDTRGEHGPKFAYALRLRHPNPDYKVLISPAAPSVPRGGSAILSVEAERYDGFNGPIAVEIQNLPAGFTATQTTIEPGENNAEIQITADAAMMTPTSPKSASYRVTASAMIGQEVERTIEPDEKDRRLSVVTLSKVSVSSDMREAVVHPGGDVSIQATIVRTAGFTARVPLDVHNLPFGVKVMDIGLNGVLIPEGETSRRFVIHAEPWVAPQTRLIYLTAGVEGGVGTAALPITLQIR